MTLSELRIAIQQGEFDTQFEHLNYRESLEKVKERYLTLLDKAKLTIESSDEVILLSSPGRCEIIGNHTDHQLGKVIGASINLDTIALVTKVDKYVYYSCDNYLVDPICVESLEKNPEDLHSTQGLIKGILFKFKELGFNIGGFKMVAMSNVLHGAGISSSASFEMLIGTALNHLFNKGSIDLVTIAKIGQYSENHYFGKPCGLLDQLACGYGGMVRLDFNPNANNIIEKIAFDYTAFPYSLVLVDTGENHADLSDAYASIPFEMKKVSQYFNKEVLTQITESDLFNNAHHIRKTCGDRSFLRAYHLLEENQRVDQLEQALVRNDFKLFDQLIIESGNSSALYLQNVICDFEKQSLMLALAMAQSYLRDAGSYRIHGGGFAGTILAFVPKEHVLSFCKFMELMFMENCCQELFIRPVGTYVFNYDGS